MTSRSGTNDRGAKFPFRAVVRYVGYKGWWWHIEDADGRLVSFGGGLVTDIKEPDGVALRGRTLTRRGAKARAARGLSEANRSIPPEGGWKRNTSCSAGGKAWADA